MSNEKSSKRKARNKQKKEQSQLSKILNSSTKPRIVKARLFKLLPPRDILFEFNNISSHPFFSSHINLTLNSKFQVYEDILPNTDFLTSLNWLMGLVIHHKEKIKVFIG